MTSDASTPGRSPHVLRNRGFMVFAVSQAISLFGDKLDYMALLAMVAYFTERYGWDGARVLSTVPVVMAMPAVLFGPLAGVLVDRWDRRKVMIASDVARTLLVLAIPLAALATNSLPIIYAIAFAVFLFGVFFQTARLSSIPNLVGIDRVLGANSVMNVVGRVATVLGMLGGGLIVDYSGWARIGIRPSWAAGFYVDGLTYAVSVVALIIVYRRMLPQQRLSGATASAPGQPLGRVVTRQVGRVLTDLREALALVRRVPTVTFVYFSVLMLVFVGAGWIVLYVPIIQSKTAAGLGLGTRGVGYIAGIGAVGLLLSTTAYGILRGVPKHRVMLVCFILIGLAAVGLAFARRFEYVAPLAFVAGLGISPLYIGMDTLLHETVPEQARGRIFSTREWLMHLSFAVFSFGIGQATRLLPSRRLLLVIGAVVAAAGVVGFFVTRRRGIG